MLGLCIMTRLIIIAVLVWDIADFSCGFSATSLPSSRSSLSLSYINCETGCRHHSLTRPRKSWTKLRVCQGDDVGTVEQGEADSGAVLHEEDFLRISCRPEVGRYRDSSRRAVLSALLSSVGLANTASAAGGDDEFDPPMNDLTRRIRTSVVRGAQLIDEVDGRWERFSDDLGLGVARNQPKRNIIDAGGNDRSKKVVKGESIVGAGGSMFDEKFALEMLQQCDQAFLSCGKSKSQISTTQEQLMQQIDVTKQLVRKSFLSSSKPPSAEEAFNFECYAHFRAFNEILVEQKVTYPPFRKEFESIVGNRLLKIALQQEPSLLPSMQSSANLMERLQNALRSTDAIATLLQRKGIIASWERSIPADDDIEDFTLSTASSDNFSVSSDIPYSLALNGDVTLNSQILLQELGYRMYPSFGRWLVQASIAWCFSGNNDIGVQIDDYYMDTSYNSNPDLFEVKQVLLNIVIQRD